MLKKPKICVSIIEKKKPDIFEKARLLAEAGIEMIEWRVDYFEGISNSKEVLAMVQTLKREIVPKELIFTLRTVAEGGEKIPGEVSYAKVLAAVISQGQADYVDIEIYRETELIKSLFSLAMEKGQKTIGSYHDFEKTPPQSEIELRILYMKKLGATIGKIAVMPTSEEDVEVLLQATDIIKRSKPDFPIITMSMGKMGKKSRIYGGLYGSEVTFGTMGMPSAPGQIPVKELKKTLDALYSGKKHIILIGFMGVGKTTISEKLGESSGRTVVDTDHLITMMEGRSIEDIFAVEGESYFRELETKSIDRLAGLAPCIVSCGGGMVLKDINVRKLKLIGTIVLLTAEPTTIFSRVKDSDSRPILNGNMNKEYISELMEKRRPYYESASELTVSTDGKEVSEIADEILNALSVKNS